MSEVIALKTKPVSKKSSVASKPRRTSPTPVKSETAKRRLRIQARLGIFMAIMGTILLFLSVSHLATGIQTFTQGHYWEALAFSITVDVGFICLEMTQIINISESVKKEVDKYAKPTIICLILASALINAYVFSMNTSGYIIYISAFLGFAIPFLTYSLFRVASTLIMTAHR